MTSFIAFLLLYQNNLYFIGGIKPNMKNRTNNRHHETRFVDDTANNLTKQIATLSFNCYNTTQNSKEKNRYQKPYLCWQKISTIYQVGRWQERFVEPNTR